MPSFGSSAILEKIVGKGIEPKVAFLLLFAVALETVLCEDGPDLLLEINRSRDRQVEEVEEYDLVGRESHLRTIVLIPNLECYSFRSAFHAILGIEKDG